MRNRVSKSIEVKISSVSTRLNELALEIAGLRSQQGKVTNNPDSASIVEVAAQLTEKMIGLTEERDILKKAAAYFAKG